MGKKAKEGSTLEFPVRVEHSVGLEPEDNHKLVQKPILKSRITEYLSRVNEFWKLSAPASVSFVFEIFSA